MRCSLRFLCDWFVSREWMFYDGYYDGDNWDDEDKSKISKTLNKRRTLTHCLAPIKILGLVYFRG